MQKAQALVNQLQTMKDEAQGIAQKISELDQERHEHSLVAETLEKLDSDRKCYRCVHPRHGAAHTAPAHGAAHTAPGRLRTRPQRVLSVLAHDGPGQQCLVWRTPSQKCRTRF